MSKIKGMLEEDMIRYPELYDGSADYEFWIQCRKEELLEREGKPTIKITKKGKSNVRKEKKDNKI
jgi:hypothetical protein